MKYWWWIASMLFVVLGAWQGRGADERSFALLAALLFSIKGDLAEMKESRG